MPKKKRDPAEDQARVEERRRQILDAAALVFARRGYQRARTREIAAEAGVAEGTLYNYYESKRDLLLALVHRMIAETTPALLAKLEHRDAATFIESVIRDRFAMLDRNRSVLLAIVPELLVDAELRDAFLRRVVIPFTSTLMPLIQRRFPDEQIKAFDPHVVMPAMMGSVMFSYIVNELPQAPLGPPLSRERLVAELVEFVLHGVGRPAAVALEEVQA